VELLGIRSKVGVACHDESVDKGLPRVVPCDNAKDWRPVEGSSIEKPSYRKDVDTASTLDGSSSTTSILSPDCVFIVIISFS